MALITASQPIRSARIKAVLWPGCSECHAPNPHGLSHCHQCGARTPPPRDYGTVAFYHRNPLRRLAWWLGRMLVPEA